jgi:threonine aldolase
MPGPDDRIAVNLYSDTQSRPTAAMRRAMADADVGDEQRGADPSTNALQERVAELLGHEAALFLPTGTMCNVIGFRIHLRPDGEEALVHRTAHPRHFESGGAGAISGATVEPLDGEGGMFDAETLRAAIRPPGRHFPRTRLVAVEQTTNLAGGRVWPLERIEAVLGVAREHGLRAHLDGARLLNASVASGVPAADYASDFDTAWIDMTKGLGAPVGAVLAGDADLIEEAWRYKHMLGGAMRQSGVLAAAALHALDHHVERLAEDHEHARVLADGLAQLPGVTLDPATVETNIVVFDVPDAPAFCAALQAEGVLMGAMSATTVRAVTHLDVDRAGIDTALRVASSALQA